MSERIPEHQNLHQSGEALNEQKALRVTSITITATLVIAGFYYFLAWQLQAWSAGAMAGIFTAYSLAAWLARGPIRKGRVQQGAWIILGGLWGVLMFGMFFVAGTGWLSGITAIFLTYIISWQSLPRSQRPTALIGSVVAGSITIALDTLGLDNRLGFAQIQASIPVLTVAFLLIVFYFVVRQTWQESIRNRLVASFLGLVIIPLVLSAFISALVLRQAAINDVYNHLSAITVLKENQLKDWEESMFGTLDITLRERDEKEVVRLLLQGDPNSADFQAYYPEVAQDVETVLERTGYFKEIFLLDSEGNVVLSTEPNQVGKIFANQPIFQEGIKGKYVQPPTYVQALGEIVLWIGQPLHDETGQGVGVIAGRADLDVVSEFMLQDIGLGETGESYLVRSNYAMLTASRFEGYLPGETYVRTEGANNAIENIENGNGAYLDYRGVAVFGAYRWLPELGVALIAEVDQSQALASTLAASATSGGVAVGAAIFAVLVALLITRTIANPLGELVTAARRLAAGELAISVEMNRQDEIGTLAGAFNDMAGQLTDLIGSLEQRVAERTKALATSTEVSRRLSTILDQEELVREVVDQIKQAFNYYHVHIYLWDTKRENLVMAGGTGEAGRLMLESGHSIPAERGLVGRAAETGTVVLVSDVAQTIGWLPNPLLPETKAEIAVPILLGETVLGVLDVQQNKVGGITQNDADLLQAIANQVASALQNARIYGATQQQANKEAQRNEIIQKIQNTPSVEDALKVAVRELGRALGTQTSVHLSDYSEPLIKTP
ncbi:MAG: GAF domain-containing protein [Anaerolineales bacterium]|nr:GAF domain-containing protein [Anaerolineales bacterium]